MANIIVTGGAGFIGSHLCRKLLAEDNSVICLDNLFTGSIDNIKDLIDKSNFKFVEHDVIDEFYENDLDEIYNLACPASPAHYQYDSVKTTKTSVLGIINMLELAKRNNAKILQASTSEVYGNPLIHPQTENYFGNVNPVGSRSCYDEGKRCAETFMHDYHNQYNLKTKIIRIFNTYGPNMAINDGRVVSNFIVQALKGENITIYGDGSQTRSFCYVDDLVNGIIKMMDSNSDFTGPLNLGNPSEITILDLAHIVIDLTNSKSKIVYKALPADDPIKRKPDITLAKEKINWEPYTDIETGLIKTIKYFEEALK